MRPDGPAYRAWIAERARDIEATRQLADKLRKLGSRTNLKPWHLAEVLVDHEITLDLIAFLVAPNPEAMQRALVEDRSKRARAAAKKPRRAKAWHATDLLKFKATFEKKHGRERGWKTAAAIDAGISISTVNRRLDL